MLTRSEQDDATAALLFRLSWAIILMPAVKSLVCRAIDHH